eukprot:scaffold7717_cov51-Cyclotella_meneghiniana.AAC.2
MYYFHIDRSWHLTMRSLYLVPQGVACCGPLVGYRFVIITVALAFRVPSIPQFRCGCLFICQYCIEFGHTVWATGTVMLHLDTVLSFKIPSSRLLP